MTYEGWSNASTWYVNLLIDNNQAASKTREVVLRQRSIPVDETCARTIWSKSLNTIYKDLDPDFRLNLAEVNWAELAEDWELIRKELKNEYS